MFERLIALPESRTLDFKSGSYWQSGKADGDAAFIKDLLSFINTVRNGPAYIITGIKNNGAVNTLVGDDEFPDEAILQEKARSKIGPKPYFEAGPFIYKGKTYGIIEVPVHYYTRPVTATVKLPAIVPGIIYLRRGSSNDLASEDEINEIREWLVTLKPLVKPLPLPEKRIYKAPDPYIPRTVASMDNEPFSFYFQNFRSLLDVLSDHKRIALLAWGLDGKSTELAHLAFVLSDDPYYFPVLIFLGDYADKDIEYLIPEIDAIPQDRLVLLLDGLDEVIKDNLSLARRKISEFLTVYPNVRIVVSCRSNMYTTVSDGDPLNTLSGFDSFGLNRLNQETIDAYLDDFPVKKTGEFFNEIAARQMGDLLAIPYYLIKLAGQYYNQGKISASKAELFESELQLLIAKEILRAHGSEDERINTRLYGLLKRLAFVMELQGTNTILTPDLRLVLPDDADFELVTGAAAIFQGTHGVQKSWKFNHYTTQEYLAARVLAKLPFSKLRRVIGIAPASRHVKPTWVNTLSFLNSILKPDATLKRKITRWLAAYNKDLVIRLEPEKLDDNLRYKTFVNIFNFYKRQNRLINNVIYSSMNLARFAETSRALGFLVGQLENSNSNTTFISALLIINQYRVDLFPGFLKQLKKIYEKALFGSDPELHYVALAGYPKHFKLTAAEFGAMFDRYNGSDDTEIRYELFHAIWSADKQDVCLDYVLTQADVLIKEDWQLSHEKKKDRNEKEYREIAYCIEALRSENALMTFFERLGSIMVFIPQATHFTNTVEHLLDNAAEHLESEALVGKVMAIFLGNHSHILQSREQKKWYLNFLSLAGKVEDACITLYRESTLRDATDIKSIAILATRGIVDFLFKDFQEGRFTAKTAGDVAYFMEDVGNLNEPYFRGLFAIPRRVHPVRDFEAENRVTYARNLAALFDKEIYKQEISLIFNTYGKTVLNYEGINYQKPDYWSEIFCKVAREALDLNPQEPEADLVILLEQADLYFDANFTAKIYNYLVKNPRAELNPAQTAVIVRWCNQQAKRINFKTAIEDYVYPHWMLDEAAVQLSFFMRMLSLKKYRKALYLDMLSFIKQEDNLVGIFDFVAGICEHAMIVARVLVNLAEGVNNVTALKGHLEFIKAQRLTGTLPLFIPYFSKNDDIRYDLLTLYASLDGDMDLLLPVLLTVDGYFRNRLIEELIRKGHPLLRGYVYTLFNNETDEKEKLALSRYLIMLQDRSGFDFYVGHVKKNLYVPDDTSAGNPLFLLRDPLFTQPVLDLIVFAATFRKTNHRNDLSSISIRALQNLALYPQNYRKVRRNYDRWVFRNKLLSLVGRGKVPASVYPDLQFYWEIIDQQYYTQQTEQYDIPGAIAVYQGFHQSKPAGSGGMS